MEEKITVSAKTLDEAITKALIELQTTSEHLQYDVVQKESSGFLGLFGKPCIIRARVMSEEEERAMAAAKKAEEKKKAAEEKAAAQKAAAQKEAAQKEAAKKEAARKETAQKTAVQKPVPEKKEDKPAEKKERKEFQKREKKEQAPKQENVQKPHQPEAKSEPVEKKEKPLVKVNEEAVKKAAKEFLEQVFGAMGLKVSIEVVYDAEERELQVSMAGDDMGILIGKRGQTLDSLQYLVSLVVNKETEGYLRVKLDTENYRERRKETLETLAKNISYKVKRTKHPVSLEPMNPYERRIIHSALQNDRYVVTRSEGEDPYRHVVISLKKEAYGNGNGRRDRYGNKKDRNRDGRSERNSERTCAKPVEKPEKMESLEALFAEKPVAENPAPAVETES